ncbi:MAG: iron-sulfur cluster insertion protein ErpA [Gammaproteobacteria bacterium RIFCSPHIGHO2_12_FULL_37_14]|nr:MAG: iron-sulfur cluster insertion protein ErpA [Gammaproteobacteria bacterium RIFCSPHIGHO2_12_FULL_37_14]
MSDPLIFTERAATKVWSLMEEDGNLNLKLRVYVTGGGCSGFQYGFTFTDEIQPDDTIISKSIQVKPGQVEEDDEDGDEEGDSGNGATTVQLLVDSLSFQYLAGAEIDYQEDIEGEQFIIRNPNAKTTCGCGSSFTAE